MNVLSGILFPHLLLNAIVMLQFFMTRMKQVWIVFYMMMMEIFLLIK